MKCFITIIALFTFIHCKGQSNTEIGIVGPDYLYEMKGKIDNLKVDMFYRISISSFWEDSISGYYYYEKYHRPINILGSIIDDTVQIYEFDSKSNKVGLFKGNVNGDSVFNGIWINLKSKKKMKFELKRMTTPFKNIEYNVFVKSDSLVKFYDLSDSEIPMPVDFYILDYSQKDGDKFFLFKIGSPSIYGNINGFCGRGYEEKVVLMQIDNKLNMIKQSSYLINSCIYDYYTDEINWEDRKYLKIKGNCNRNDAYTEFLITYDKSNPENGLNIEYTKE